MTGVDFRVLGLVACPTPCSLSLLVIMAWRYRGLHYLPGCMMRELVLHTAFDSRAHLLALVAHATLCMCLQGSQYDVEDWCCLQPPCVASRAGAKESCFPVRQGVLKAIIIHPRTTLVPFFCSQLLVSVACVHLSVLSTIPCGVIRRKLFMGLCIVSSSWISLHV